MWVWTIPKGDGETLFIWTSWTFWSYSLILSESLHIHFRPPNKYYDTKTACRKLPIKDLFHKTLGKDCEGGDLQLYQARVVAGRNGWTNFPSDSPRHKQIMTAAASLQLMHCICKDVVWYFGKWAYGPFPSHSTWGVSQPRIRKACLLVRNKLISLSLTA